MEVVIKYRLEEFVTEIVWLVEVQKFSVKFEFPFTGEGRNPGTK